MEHRESGLRPHLAAAGAAVIFGFSFLVTKNALDSLETFELLGLRFFLAAFFMLFLRRLKLIQVELSWDKLGSLLVVAVFQPVLYFICETVGVNLTSASVAGVLIALIPVAVALLAAALLKERLSGEQWVFIATSVTGVVLLSRPQLQGGLGGVKGILALLGAVVAAALYNIASRQASSKAAPVEVTYVMMWVGAVAFNAVVLMRAALTGRPLTYFLALGRWETASALLYLGLLSSVGAFFLLNYALAKLSASRVAVFTNLTPVFSILAGVLFRGERLLAGQLIGAAIVLVGVWGVSKRTQKSLP